MSSFYLKSFPRQKLTSAQKTPAWARECIEIAVDIMENSEDYVRASFKRKRANLNLRNNVIDYSDVEKIIDPHKIGADVFPDTFRHIGIGNNKINLLLGEELNRKDEYRPIIASHDADGVSQKEQELMTLLTRKTTEIIRDTSVSPEEAQRRLKQLQEYARYDYQDINELIASKIVKTESKRLNLPNIFNYEFESGLTVGEEIVYAGLEADAPVVRPVNKMNFYTIGSGKSNRVEDADVKVYFEFLPIGQVIDRYYDQLTSTEIDNLEKGSHMRNMRRFGRNDQSLERGDIPVSDMLPWVDNGSGLYILSDTELGAYKSSGFNADGEIRVAIVNWTSRMMIQKVKTRDSWGNVIHIYVDEKYVVKEDEGEELVKRIWINDEWEGTLIGDDIFVNVRSIPQQDRSIFNLSKRTGNFIGEYHVNGYQGPVQSLMDVMKPLDYTYDIVWWKREQAIALYEGDILIYNENLTPSDWETEEWQKYITLKRRMPLDPSNEILKGPNQGKSAGAFNQLTAQRLDGSGLQEIKMLSEVLLNVEDTLGKISGVSPQREAQIKTSETVGGVERALQKSSHITEKHFFRHGEFKRRVYLRVLNLALYAYKNNPELVKYSFDDMGMVALQMMSDVSKRAFDMYMTNSGDDLKLLEDLKALAQAAMQNQQILIGDYAKILRGESISEIARRLDASTEKLLQQRQQEAEQVAKQEQAKQEKEAQQRLLEIDAKGFWDLEVARERANSQNTTQLEEDIKRIEAEIKQRDSRLKEQAQQEVERANREKEAQGREKLAIERAKAAQQARQKRAAVA